MLFREEERLALGAAVDGVDDDGDGGGERSESVVGAEEETTAERSPGADPVRGGDGQERAARERRPCRSERRAAAIETTEHGSRAGTPPTGFSSLTRGVEADADAAQCR